MIVKSMLPLTLWRSILRVRSTAVQISRCLTVPMARSWGLAVGHSCLSGLYANTDPPQFLGPKPEVDFSTESAHSLEYSLARLYGRSMKGDNIPLGEVRDALREAARLICSSSNPRLSVVHYLVALPFQIFTKETIKLGVSLWLGVIHENPSIEPRILAHVVEAWDKSIQRRQGLFDPTFEYETFIPRIFYSRGSNFLF